MCKTRATVPNSTTQQCFEVVPNAGAQSPVHSGYHKQQQDPALRKARDSSGGAGLSHPPELHTEPPTYSKSGDTARHVLIRGED